MGLAIISKSADFSNKNIGQVTPVNIVELSSLSIVGPDSVNNSAQFEVGYSPTNTTQRGVTWSIKSGSENATINTNTGLLTTLSGADNSSVTIKVTSKAKPSVSAEKTVTATHIHALDWNDLLATNQTQYRSRQKSDGVIDGWVYYFIYADDQSKVGQNLSTVMGSTMEEEGTLQCFKIPVSGFSTIRVPVFKSSAGLGYAFTDDSDVVKGLYQNSTIDSGTYQDIAIPSGATYLYLPLTASIYTAVGTNMTATLS